MLNLFIYEEKEKIEEGDIEVEFKLQRDPPGNVDVKVREKGDDEWQYFLTIKRKGVVRMVRNRQIKGFQKDDDGAVVVESY